MTKEKDNTGGWEVEVVWIAPPLIWETIEIDLPTPIIWDDPIKLQTWVDQGEE